MIQTLLKFLEMSSFIANIAMNMFEILPFWLQTGKTQYFKYCTSEMCQELEMTATASAAVRGNLKIHTCRIKNKKQTLFNTMIQSLQ